MKIRLMEIYSDQFKKILDEVKKQRIVPDDNAFYHALDEELDGALRDELNQGIGFITIDTFDLVDNVIQD